MGEFSNTLLSLYARAAADQGGVISGDNPTHYNASNPIRLWILQLLLIVGITQLLALALARIRQPRVIAEVIGGIILGPTVMGRIPGFKNAIFPDASIPLLVITSNIGLILFLFIIGLEIDTKVLKRNIPTSAAVSAAGIALPLAMGAGLGVGVYNTFIDDSVSFGHFLLFIAVAVGITAFPVLCRILSDLKLLETDVGLIVLSAGSCDDVVGWVLLALTVALVNASGGLTALWVLLASSGFILFVLFPCRWAFKWLAKRTGSLEQGAPTPFYMTVTLLFVFVSAFFTDILGVHAIFGGFIAGVIIPHENGLAISMVEKIEDMVTILFLPIYFTLSGLRTNLGLLNSGPAWGYTILTCFVSLFSKFTGCATAAHFRGFNWRECGAIGSLMSCKGLVELIVLNIGLQAGILNPRVFSIFVVHALVLTFITTPMTLLFYPPKHRTKRDGKKTTDEEGGEHKSPAEENKSRFSIIFDKVEQLPAAMTLTRLFLPSNTSSSTKGSSSVLQEEVSVDALRLVELTSRTSAVLRSQEAQSLAQNDPIISVYRTFGQLNRIKITASLSVVNHDEFPEAIANHASQTGTQLVILPWSRGVTSALAQHTGPKNPFDGVFHRTTTEDQTSSVVYSEYIRRVFSTSTTDVALFVERGSAAPNQYEYHFILPFFGGPDDRAALSLLVQLCQNPEVSATVVRILKSDREPGDVGSPSNVEHPPTYHHTVAAADTVYGRNDTQTRIASDTADNILWGRYAVAKPPATLSRVNFMTASSPTPLHYLIDLAKATSASNPNQGLIVLGGRSRRLAVENHQEELRGLMADNGGSFSSSVPRTLGDVGAAVVAANVNASLLIVQSAGPNATDV